MGKCVMAGKPILCVDFDGVIHSYTSGWQGACVIPDTPVTGAFDWLYRASEWWDVQVYSSRSKEPGAIDAMKAWFRKHADDEFQGLATGALLLDVLSFPTQKPAANMTIDDRALCFEGSWAAIDARALLDFKPWNKRELGATGRFPQGRVSDDDEGELTLGVAFDPVDGIVRIEFGKPVAWLGLPRDNAVAFARAILRRAGAKTVEVTF
jgi:hypothetical protein